MPFCEVRVPTYKRPVWLKRALESLLSQDFQEWKAIVMDDSPEQEGRIVVDSLKDERLIYSPNARKLGGPANLDRAFFSQAYLGGSWACVLEDDNWLKPAFLSENIRCLREKGTSLLLRNQEVWCQSKGDATPSGLTTRGRWFKEGYYNPPKLYAYLFFFEGISNGGLFWKTDIESNLQVGPTVRDAGLQEYCRTLQIVETVYFAAEPLCVWSQMSSELAVRTFLNSRSFGRGRQSILRFLIQKYRREIINHAEGIASELKLREEFENTLLDALFTKLKFRSVKKYRGVKRYLKSYAKYKLVEDPLKDYLSLQRQ